MHSSLLSLQSERLCHIAQNIAYCATGVVLELLVVRSWGYPDLFWVEPVEIHCIAMH